ncbi:alanine racemase [Sphingomonas sp. DG1-23]|uniref:alanine racemase n=1 Tax=Sphingomonas sp. DG1-23 TaxID=3068316 RepID=UPI00273E6146|nr:alanine racemase [Sphingomonas sp. DG1-23]MDP5277379.1 alanine racemase [Sphingomonas sp. DG1-23]
MTCSPLRLKLDGDALVGNWHLLRDLSGGAACGAAVKADGYGLGAREVVRRLVEAGCRDFFVAVWSEARALADIGVSVSVLHGVRDADMADRPANARPVLDTVEQVRRWREAGGGACDVMVDTGMNRLGVAAEDVAAGLLDGLAIDTLMSHLACADEDVPLNAQQRAAFAGLRERTSAKRMSLANSAGIALGSDYAFDLTRPGIALYGGRQRAAHDGIRQVATPEAQILQRRRVRAGEIVGYNATFTAPAHMEVAVLNLGYADGYLRCFSGRGRARAGDAVLPVIGRVSMDLTAIAVDAAPGLAEGDWVAIDYALPETAALSGLSQYELLTGLGSRFERVWS